MNNHIRRPLKILTPARILVLSFLGLILAGTVLLLFPFSVSQRGLSFIDALFTSTSAVCVTGLAVIDIGKELSTIGEIVTMLLFQFGGLGIITFSVVLFGLMGRTISFKEREILQSTFLHTPRRDIFLVIKWVLFSTLTIEGIGTLLLFLRFASDFSAGQALYQALYHSVSAFNNCGYSLFPNNLMNYQGDWLVNLTIMALIIIGGIGFIVIYEVYNRVRHPRKKLSLHSKIVLLVTGGLIVVGAILFYIFEAQHILKGESTSTGILTSLFHSVTPRTCGFNTVDVGQLSNPTILLTMTLMLIGASPGSTGGGIKTTSFALLMLIIWNRFRGQEGVNIYNRTVPREILTRTIAIVFASVFSIFLVTSFLLLVSPSESLPPVQSRHFFVEYIFESISAFGTVGLSMGTTATLTGVQKLAIVFLMFAGRVGPLTLAFSWHAPKKEIIYAEESVMVG